MTKHLKYLFLPITVLIWYLIGFYGIYFSIFAVGLIFKIKLIWIILFDTFIFGLVYGIIVGIPQLLEMMIMWGFRRNLLVLILHSLAGLLGVIHIIFFLIQRPPMLAGEKGEVFFIFGMWDIAPVKTIFIIFPSLFYVLGLIYSTIIAPVVTYFELKDENSDEEYSGLNSEMLQNNYYKEEIISSNSNLVSETNDKITGDKYSMNTFRTDQVGDYHEIEKSKPNLDFESGNNISNNNKSSEPETHIDPSGFNSPERLYIPATYKDPLVDFNPNGQLWIKGRSIPEDAFSFFYDLIEWINKLCKSLPEEIVLNIQLTNHNDTASKYILYLLKILRESDANMIINWYYEEWDEEIIFLGEMMSSCIDIPFNFVVIDNSSNHER